MRVWITIFIVSVAACTSGVKGKNGIVYKDAAQYNQYIMDNQKDVIAIMLEFGRVIKIDLDSADKVLDRGVETTREALNNLKGMPPFKGDSLFRNTAIESFEFYQDVMSNEYKHIITIRRKGVDKTTADLTFLQNLPDKIGRREERYDKNFHNAQKAFADRNHLKLVRNEMQDKVE